MLECLNQAEKCDQVADQLLAAIKQGKIKLEPYITDQGERQPPQAVVAIGALRQRARNLRANLD